MALCQLKAVFHWGICSLFLLIFLTSCKKQAEETLPFYNSADFTAEWITKENPKYTEIHQVDDFAFTDQQNKSYSSDSLKDKIYVANFFFTACPTICPKMTSNLSILQDKFLGEKDFKMVSFSVTPWRDSVSQLKEYAALHKINGSKWHLLTGDKTQIYALGRKSFFAEKTLGLTKDSTDFLHTESLLLIDKKGRIRGVYNATQETDIERVTDDIALLLKE